MTSKILKRKLPSHSEHVKKKKVTERDAIFVPDPIKFDRADRINKVNEFMATYVETNVDDSLAPTLSARPDSASPKR